MWLNPQFPGDLFRFTKEIFNGKLHFLRSVKADRLKWFIKKFIGFFSKIPKVSVCGVFLVSIFLHSDWIRTETKYLSVFSQKAGKCGQEKFRIRTIFTQWKRSPTLIFWSHQNRYLKKSLDVSHRYIFSKVYLKTCQTSIIKLFAGWKPVTVLQEKLDHRSLIGSSKHTAF